MPKNINYQKSLIYKIVCNDTNIKNVYIGSTTNFRIRKQQHKTSCNNENSSKHNYPLYMFIRNNGGWNNWDMILVNYVPCDTKLELHKIEREYIETIDSNLVLNKYIPLRTKEECNEYYKEYHKEYKEANKDKLKEYYQKYYEDNKERKKEYHKEYKEANKDKIKEKMKKYYQVNKEKMKKYYQANKEKIKEQRLKKIYQ